MMREQPQAGVKCVACGHYGAEHLRIGDQPAGCRCGCREWDRTTERKQPNHCSACVFCTRVCYLTPMGWYCTQHGFVDVYDPT